MEVSRALVRTLRFRLWDDVARVVLVKIGGLVDDTLSIPGGGRRTGVRAIELWQEMVGGRGGETFKGHR